MQSCWAVLRSSDHERVCDATLKNMNSMFDALVQNAWEWWNAKMIRARATLLANVNLKCVCVDGTAVCCNSKAEGLIKCTRKLETQWMLNFGQALNRWLQQTWIWAEWQRQRREKWGDAFGSLCTLLAGYRVWLLSFSNDLFVRYHMAPGARIPAKLGLTAWSNACAKVSLPSLSILSKFPLLIIHFIHLFIYLTHSSSTLSTILPTLSMILLHLICWSEGPLNMLCCVLQNLMPAFGWMQRAVKPISRRNAAASFGMTVAIKIWADAPSSELTYSFKNPVANQCAM